jgi:hypothetical protein
VVRCALQDAAPVAGLLLTSRPARIMHYAAPFFVRSRGARAPPRPVTPSIEKIRTRNEHQKTGGDIRDPSRNDEGPDASRVF